MVLGTHRMNERELREKLGHILRQSIHEMPDEKGFGGTGGPGKLLERLLGINGSNHDTPDAGKWEIKSHGGKSLLTFLHLEAQPKKHLEEMVQRFGYPISDGRLALRHTLTAGKISNLGFYIENKGERINIKNLYANSDEALCFWTHDQIINAFTAKMRRLVVVKTRRYGSHIDFQQARMYWEPRSSGLIKLIMDGVIKIDFDARMQRPDSPVLRNHGTKFRARIDDLENIYTQRRIFTEDI